MSDSDSDGSLFGRSRSTKWRKKRQRLDENSSDEGDLEEASDENQPASDDNQLASDDSRSSETHSEVVEDAAQPSIQEGSEDNLEDSSEEHHEEDSGEDHEELNSTDNQRVDSDEDDENIVDEEYGPAFQFNEGAMNQFLQVQGNSTVREALVLDLALSFRYKWTYESLIANFGVKNLLYGQKFFPSSKRELFRVLGRDDSSVVPYLFCECGNLIGKKQDIVNVARCGCGKEVPVSKAKVFYCLSLKQQFKLFLETPGIPELLKYRETRKKQNDAAIEDVFDSKRYKELSKNMTPLDFTYTFNTDGCKISKGAKISIYPVFARVNELPPQARQKFIFLIGLYGDKVEPNMASFLNPISDEMNAISSEGVHWYHNGDRESVIQHSRFLPLCFCRDGKACSQILNMVNYASNYACSSCYFRGVQVDGTQRYPSRPHPLIPPYENRTHAKMVEDMIEAVTSAVPVYGHHGLSALASVRHLDLVDGRGFDDLHFMFECASKVHFELLLKEAPREIDPSTGRAFTFAAIERTLNNRLKSVRTPSHIARKPAFMKIANRDSFHGTEWRNILVFYAVPCLIGLIKPSYVKHFGMLSEAAHILSRDLIFNEDIDKAEKLIDKYLLIFDDYFGIEKTRLNMHSLKHAAQSVRNLGPLWCYSTMNFESWNHKLLTNISSPSHPLLQIITRLQIRMFLEYLSFSNSDDLSDRVKEKIIEILKMKKLRSNAEQIEEHIHVLGKAREERGPTASEREVFQRENVLVDSLKSFERIIINGSHFQTKGSVKAGALSDNSMLFSKLNTFCTIDKIITYEDMGTIKSGLLVYEHDVLPNQSQHIVGLCPQVFDLLHFLPSTSVKCPVVQIPINNVNFVAPMPIVFEID